MQIQGYIPQLNTARVTNATPILPRNAFLFAQPTVAAPTDSFEPSEAAKLAGLRTPTQNLMLFGGDRKNAVETLIASVPLKPSKPRSKSRILTSRLYDSPPKAPAQGPSKRFATWTSPLPLPPARKLKSKTSVPSSPRERRPA